MSCGAPSRRRGLRRLLLLVVAVGLVLGVTVSAYAYLTASGRGRAGATITTLPAPTITGATAGAASVRLTWSAVSAPGAGTVSYYVTRDGSTASAACPSAASPRAVTSCTDTGVSLASHTYTVTAVWRSWTGRSASSRVTVTYGAATQLVYTTQPSDGTGGVALPTQPVVTARDASNNTVADYSGTVNLSIRSGTGTAGAVLSGCTGALVNGVTRFSGCAIDRSGSNYQLRATDRTLTADSSNVDISAGPAAQLVFTSQPGGGATGGSAFPNQPVVTARDAGGNTATSYAGTVTLSITDRTGTAGATLTNCSGSRRSGVTTFSSCEIDRVGTAYQLHAEDRALGLTSSDSSAFNVIVGSTSALVFSTQPGGGATGGTAFPTQPVVTAVDAGGNTVTSYSSTVSLAIRSGTGTSGASLDNCRGTRVSGVTTFSGCDIDRAGIGYQLRASDVSRQVDSAAFNVTAGPLTQLVFTTSPSSTTTAGNAFSTQPVVAGVDAGGNTITSYAGTVALSITRDPGALSGCTPSLRSGVTTFSGCRVSRSGTGYQLHASDVANGVSGDSSTFTITAGTATQLLFTTQPAGATHSAAFTTQPVVTALDALGNVATSYSGTVNLAIKSGTGTAGASLNNCSGNRVNGVVTFTGCQIDRLGTGYVLRATESRGGSLTAESAAFNVTVGSATRFALTASTTSLTAGDAGTSLRVTALDAGGNTATSYTGVHSLTFSGSSRSPSGTAPTVTDSSGTPVAFGTPTAIAFTNGVATVSAGTNGVMVLRDDGSDSIGVSDGTIDENGNELDVTVATGRAARLGWTSVTVSTGSLSSPCLFTCTHSDANNSTTFQARVSVTDTEGNLVSNVGSGHTVRVFTPTSGAGSGGSFTSPTSGTSVTLTISNSGSAISTASFTFRAQNSGSWTQYTFSAETLAGTVYTAATAIMNN